MKIRMKEKYAENVALSKKEVESIRLDLSESQFKAAVKLYSDWKLKKEREGGKFSPFFSDYIQFKKWVIHAIKINKNKG